MNKLTNLGRILFAIPFLGFGFFHFMGAEGMAQLVPDYLGSGVFWVYLTGVAHVLAALSILINKYVQISCILLAIMLLVFAFMVHLPAYIDGNQNEMANVLKNVALSGGAFLIGGVYGHKGESPVQGD